MNRVMRCFLSLVLLTLFLTGTAALAQEATPPAEHLENLLLFTKYPSQAIGLNETPTLSLSLHTDTEAQIVNLSVQDLPADWAASFRGGGHIVDSVFVQPSAEFSVDLRVEPPANTEPGTYSFNVIAKSKDYELELPVSLTVEEQAPASMAFTVDLPSVRGKANTTFRYNLTLTNNGDTDLTVDLQAEAPSFFTVAFQSNGQEVTNIPLKANGSERLTVNVTGVNSNIPADTYPITIDASAGDVQASIDLSAEVVGQSTLSVSTSDGRLSGDAQVGQDTPISLVVENSGSAAAHSISLSASPPSGWSVDFTPQQIDQIDPGQQADVSAKLRPSDKALAGDYMITFRAQEKGGSSESADYRVTVRTSTVWGIAGIGLIAIAVGVVGFAVSRFGRR